MLTLLLGGARSGKSSLAVRRASAQPELVTFIATAEALDAEMAQRIARHRVERPPSWTVVEEPRELMGALRSAPNDAFVIVDCLTLWVSNLSDEDDERVLDAAALAATHARDRSGQTLVVSNEVGLGMVPVDAATRRWRDLLGRVNAVFASYADAAYFVLAGRLLPLSDASVLDA